MKKHVFSKYDKGVYKMPFVPAVCYDCHTVFSTQLFVRDIRINLSGLEVHKCPNCSEKGRIVGGMYEFIDYTLTVLKNENHSIYELNMLYDTFMLARELNISPKRLKRDIKKNFPEFQDLLLLLPETNEDYQLCLSILTQVLLAVIEMSRSEEHTSELQSRGHLVCRLLLEKKKRQRWLIPVDGVSPGRIVKHMERQG